MKTHNIRIVGGEYKRTPIPVVDAQGLRPTPDRVRETLFNWLRYFWNSNFHDKSVLDLFAGTGALGFEAASRGAAHVQMVERNPSVIAALRVLRDKLQAKQIRIHAGDANVVIQRMDASRFDLVLLDPPFGLGWLDALWERVPHILTPDGLVYVESESPPVIPEAFEVLRQDKAGNVHYCLVRFAATQKTVNNLELES